MRRLVRHKHALASTIALLVLTLLLTGCPPRPSDTEIPLELRLAIHEVLPDLQAYRLVDIDDVPLVTQLKLLVEAAPGTHLMLQLPAFDAAGKFSEAIWIAYHVNVRGLLDDLFHSAVWTMAPAAPTSPSLTFQGFPDWSDEELQTALEQAEAGTLDTTLLQPSVLAVINDRLEGTRYGEGDDTSATVIEHLANVLELRFGAAEAARLAKLTDANYLVYREQDFQPVLTHGEPDGESIPIDVSTSTPEVVGLDAPLTPLAHMQGRVLRPFMIADDTIFDPDTQTWAIADWYGRVDAAANRQQLFFRWANYGSDADNQVLPVNNNRIRVNTMIGGYMVLTPFGKTLINPKPADEDKCGDAGTFIDVVRSLSPDDLTLDNEYWMWWTREYGGGCAYVRTLGQTPHGRAVGWTGFRESTVAWTSFVFMHETGHIIGGTHRTDDGTSPETVADHQCRFLNVLTFGPSGPSLMSYASGTRTLCFARTPHSGTPVRNLSQVAAFLNGVLR